MRMLSSLGLLLLLAHAASAELVLRGVSWETASGRVVPGRPRSFKAIDRWVQPPSARLKDRPRALIRVVNPGPSVSDGVVLRYALSARLVKAVPGGPAGKPAEGTWTVPFYLNERRVPRVGPNEAKDVPLNDLVLDVFLKKTYRAGYWPDAIKIQVMVEPRAGEGLDQRILEQTLPVVPQ